MQVKRVLGTAGIGLTAIVWTLVQAAQGDWAFYALAMVLTLVTNLSIVELTSKRQVVRIPVEAPLSDQV